MNVTIMPRTIATLSGILLVVSMFLTYRTGTSAILKEKVFFGYPLDKKMQQQREKMKRQFANLIFPTASTFIIFIVLIVHEVSLNSGFGRFVVSLFIVIFGIINIVRLFKGAFEAGACARAHKEGWFSKLSGTMLFAAIAGLIGIILTQGLTAFELVNDEYYYFIALYGMLASVLIFVNLIKEYNISVTRPLKYFEKRKGLKDYV